MVTDESVDFTTWASSDVTYPDWATPIEYTLTVDNPYGPRGARFTYTLDEAKKTFSETRYLVENFSYSDEMPLYNRWKINLAADAFLFGENKLSYQISKEFSELKEGTVIYKYKRGGKEVVNTIDDHCYRNLAKSFVFRSMANAGYVEEAKTYAKEHDFKVEGTPLAATAWTLHRIGLEAEAKDLLNYATDLNNFSENPWILASNTLAATAYYYLTGDYDKAIELADIILKEGKDSTSETYFLGKDRSRGYLNNHWSAYYDLIATYDALAKLAK